ncbi:MAG: TraB/GumN family protein [Bacteroidales bacterium]
MQTSKITNTWISFNVLFFLFVPNVQSNAENKTNDRPSAIFWEIQNPKTKECSYLYGSIHIQDQRVFNIDSTVWQKMNTCKRFALEMEIDKISPITMIQYINMDSTYDILLSATDLHLLKKACSDIGMSYESIAKMRPFFLSALISLSQIPKDMDEPLDSYFLKIARKNKMEIVGIETLEDQMRVVNSISMSMQLEMMMSGIRDLSPQSRQSELDKLMTPYLNEDSEMLWNLSSDTTQIESNAEFVENFLLKRNQTMAQVMDKNMQESTVFTVIGAAHLGGPLGVVALLQQKGYKVRPLKVGLNK